MAEPGSEGAEKSEYNGCSHHATTCKYQISYHEVVCLRKAGKKGEANAKGSQGRFSASQLQKRFEVLLCDSP